MSAGFETRTTHMGGVKMTVGLLVAVYALTGCFEAVEHGGNAGGGSASNGGGAAGGGSVVVAGGGTASSNGGGTESSGGGAAAGGGTSSAGGAGGSAAGGSSGGGSSAGGGTSAGGSSAGGGTSAGGSAAGGGTSAGGSAAGGGTSAGGSSAGGGTSASAGLLVPTFPMVDLGAAMPGCRGMQTEVTFQNVGTAAVLVQGIASSAPLTHRIVGMPALPFVVAPGATMTVSMNFTPTITGRQDAKVSVGYEPLRTVSASVTGLGVATATQIDTVVQPAAGAVDVLWVMDNSGSMQPVQSAASASAPVFTDAGTMAAGGYRMGVVTTDLDGVSTAGVGTGWPGTSIKPGEFWGPGRIDASPDAGELLARTLLPGIMGSPIEKGQEAMRRALRESLGTSGPNAGFLRRDSKLAVIMVSDENDESAGTTDDYRRFLLNLKGVPRIGGHYPTTDLVRFHAVVGDLGSGCTVTGGSPAASGTDYLVLQSQTGGIFRSICGASWSSTMGALAREIFQLRHTFHLSRGIVQAPGLVVKVGGVVVSAANFTFDVGANAVVFKPNAVPPAGATVSFEYDAACVP